MGKKRIVTKNVSGVDPALKARALGRLTKKKIASGILNILSTYNNTAVTLTDASGNVLLSSSAGSLGFSGAKKGTPYAASKVAEFVAERAKLVGLKEVGIRVKGIGAGRESALRAFVAQGFAVEYIADVTPVPHNGPKAPKPRRV